MSGHPHELGGIGIGPGITGEGSGECECRVPNKNSETYVVTVMIFWTKAGDKKPFQVMRVTEPTVDGEGGS
jgi:hypothetical protein